MVLFCYKLAFLKDIGASASSLRFPVMDYLGKITFSVSSGFYPLTLGMFLSDLLSESDAYKNLRWRCIDIARSVFTISYFPLLFIHVVKAVMCKISSPSTSFFQPIMIFARVLSLSFERIHSMPWTWRFHCSIAAHSCRIIKDVTKIKLHLQINLNRISSPSSVHWLKISYSYLGLSIVFPLKFISSSKIRIPYSNLCLIIVFPTVWR